MENTTLQQYRRILQVPTVALVLALEIEYKHDKTQKKPETFKKKGKRGLMSSLHSSNREQYQKRNQCNAGVADSDSDFIIILISSSS